MRMRKGLSARNARRHLVSGTTPTSLKGTPKVAMVHRAAQVKNATSTTANRMGSRVGPNMHRRNQSQGVRVCRGRRWGGGGGGGARGEWLVTW